MLDHFWLPQRLGRVLDRLENSIDLNYDLAGLASLAAYSRWHFEKVFAEAFALTPVDFFRRKRLLHTASRLRHEPGLAIGDIAIAAGYQSYRGFAKTFKAHYGMSSQEWRFENGWRHFMNTVVQRNDGGYLAVAPGLIHPAPRVPPLPISLRHFGPTIIVSRHIIGTRSRFAMVQALAQYRGAMQQSAQYQPGSRFIGKFHDDPGWVDQRHFCFELCMTEPAGQAAAHKMIAGGYYIVLPYRHGHPPFLRLYQDWLERQSSWGLDSARGHLRCLAEPAQPGWLALPVKRITRQAR